MARAATGRPASQPAGQSACLRACDSQQIKIIAKKVEKFQVEQVSVEQERASQPADAYSLSLALISVRTVPRHRKDAGACAPDQTGGLRLARRAVLSVGRSRLFEIADCLSLLARRETHRACRGHRARTVRMMCAPTIHRATKFARLERRAKEKKTKRNDKYTRRALHGHLS